MSHHLVPRHAGPTIAAVLGFMLHGAALPAQSPTLSFTGQVFASYGYALKTDSALVPPAHDNNFDITRAQLIVLGKFTDGITTQVGGDIDSRKAASNQLTYRLKYANVSWQPNGKGPLNYKFGLMNTPWTGWEDALWDYRMQGTSAMDRNGYFTITDFGAGIDGNWNQDKVSLQTGVYNGEGYNSAPGDAGKDVDTRLSIRLKATDVPGRVGGLRASAYAGLGRATGGGTRERFIGMLSYRSKRMTLVGELVHTQDSTGASTPRQKGSLVSVFGVYNVPATKVAVIGRVDRVDPNVDSASTATNVAGNLAVNRQTRLIAGVSYTMSPNMRVLLDADLNSLEHGGNNAFDKSRQMLYFHTEFKF